jgi:REP element-mobilizing transposase RayT
VKRKGQLGLELIEQFGWGGKRSGAGRKPAGDESGVSHRRRIETDARYPVHVTLRARPHVWNLRSLRSFSVIARGLRGVLGREDFRVVHYTILGNHLHLIVEADSAAALANGMRSLSGRAAIGLNRMMGRRGPVFEDRYFAHVLHSPSEVERAVAYVLGNFASHILRGVRIDDGPVDPYSSAAAVGPDGRAPPISEPRSWLLRSRASAARERAGRAAG